MVGETCIHEEIRLQGLSNREFLLLYNHAISSHFQESSLFLKQMRLLFGGIDEEAPGTVDEQLRKFPNDVKYFTDAQINAQLRYWRRKLEGKTGVTEGRIWDQRRAAACKGSLGIAARRCSMDNKLWELWCSCMDVGQSPTLEQVFMWFQRQFWHSVSQKHPDPTERSRAFCELRKLNG